MSDGGWNDWGAPSRAPQHDPLIVAPCIEIFEPQTRDQIVWSLVLAMKAACVVHVHGWRME